MILTDEDNHKAKFDRTTGAIATQTDAHKMSHDGLAYEALATFTAIAAAGTVDIVFSVPSGYELSADPFYSANQDIQVDIFSYDTISSPGTAVTTHNLKFGSANTPNSTITHTPSGLGTPTQVFGPRYLFAAGVGTTRSILGGFAEIHIPEGLYVYRITNKGSSAAIINMGIIFYEETV